MYHHVVNGLDSVFEIRAFHTAYYTFFRNLGWIDYFVDSEAFLCVDSLLKEGGGFRVTFGA
jgi:hypothetical protein